MRWSSVPDLELCPIDFAEACEFIYRHHRHHPTNQGHKFSVGVADGDRVVGVAMVGIPRPRHFNDGLTLEVNRSCTDGTRNANSMLYGAAWRGAKALGYRRLITYTLASESGASLRAAGWRVVAVRPTREGWDAPGRPRVDKTQNGVERTLWEAV
ncbi:Uncharacterised protein [Mycobacteroides abscessus subsp. abscessus]|nr:Uncharacterised protein [Mycobacteroides abscessus subsp. abscessus]SIK59884.1 Uncharacterised protein [Mycobacteroides abscessus subsp. abscessus]SIL82054.1 Uncharacterised protein [Mycobacteroides abscessus subsp. abscessus]SIM15257.1 Uncharacterised protein [Mycobacteroides abscessus subsp. abscessus]SIM35649.1 Uncharacterised protein [Mycobacteroides abscessus subsp. abscessus]